MILFLDTSVILAACGSATGASRKIISLAPLAGWSLISCEFAAEEVMKNLPKIAPSSVNQWESIRPSIQVLEDILTFDRPVVFEPTKDRPILFTAAAWANVLLTLDAGDFARFHDQPFYNLLVMKPGTFLKRYRPQI